MTQRQIRVLVADDHAMVRTGLATMLKVYDEFVFVGAAANGQAAIDLCDEWLPDLVLMDMDMPLVDGITATRMIRQRHPTIKVLALTGLLQDSMIRKSLQAGATGFLLKSVTTEELVSAIHGVFADQIILSPQAALALLQVSPSASRDAWGLTEREQEVLDLMIDGLSNNSIAERLQVSAATVKSHVSNVLAKLNVTTRAEAVAFAMQRDMFS
jgi:NarL family two-component system response regulator LiaR